jgi:hypothetical protein
VQLDDDGIVNPALNVHKGLLETVEISLAELRDIAGSEDLERIDLELDRMCDLGLFIADHGGIDLHKRVAKLNPSAVALHLFARCSGHRGRVGQFYGGQAPASEGV